MIHGTCRLCQRQRPLCDSHIIPEFCYAPLYDERHKALQMSLSGRESKVQKGFREPLLCEDCERFLNDEYEKAFLRAWFTEGKCPQHAPDKVIIVAGLDYVRFRLFHLSVLWRASVSSLKQFEAVQLGAQHEEIIRNMLLDQDPGSQRRYALCALLLELNGAVVREAIMTAATHRTPDGHRVYTIAFAGCLWAHFVGNHDPRGVVAHALRPPGEITLLRKNMAQLRHLKAFLNPDERTLRQFKVRTMMTTPAAAAQKIVADRTRT